MGHIGNGKSYVDTQTNDECTNLHKQRVSVCAVCLGGDSVYCLQPMLAKLKMGRSACPMSMAWDGHGMGMAVVLRPVSDSISLSFSRAFRLTLWTSDCIIRHSSYLHV